MSPEIQVYDSNLRAEGEVVVQTEDGFRLIDRGLLRDICWSEPVHDPEGKRGRWDRLILESRAVAIARPDDVDYQIDPSYDPSGSTVWDELAETLAEDE